MIPSHPQKPQRIYGNGLHNHIQRQVAQIQKSLQKHSTVNTFNSITPEESYSPQVKTIWLLHNPAIDRIAEFFVTQRETVLYREKSIYSGQTLSSFEFMDLDGGRDQWRKCVESGWTIPNREKR